MAQVTCIESCFDSQRCELFDKGKSYDIPLSHPLISFFDCEAGKKARDAKRAKIAKLHGLGVAKIHAAQQEGPAAAALLEDPEKSEGGELDLSK